MSCKNTALNCIVRHFVPADSPGSALDLPLQDCYFTSAASLVRSHNGGHAAEYREHSILHACHTCCLALQRLKFSRARPPFSFAAEARCKKTDNE